MPKSECPIEGCTVQAGAEYLRRHRDVEHGRCLCGWVGATASIGHHRGQQGRRWREAGRPDPYPTHLITHVLRPPDPPAPPPLPVPDPADRPEIIL